MRVCVLYDCLYPYTVGGAERWYRNLAQRLAEDGHDVTYVTLRQWPHGETGEVPGVRVRTAGPRMALYTSSGRRGVLPPLVYGLGVLLHLVRRGRSYDVVHTASFPYFSLLAAALLRPFGGYRLVVDWHEVWSSSYWREYLGGLGGRVGAAVQRLCLAVPQRAFCFSRLHARRLRDGGLRGEVTVLEGEFTGPTRPAVPERAEPLVLFAGRHIPEKRVPTIVPAMRVVAEHRPGVRCRIFGDGPDRERTIALVRQAGLEHVVDVPGFVDGAEIDAAWHDASCLLLPSSREGYGLVVVEASAAAVPSVVVAGPDNAAVELVDEGVNGFVAPTADPGDLAEAVLRCLDGGLDLRERTARWYAANADRLSLESSLTRVAEAYASARL